jgi:starch phosphorylase
MLRIFPHSRGCSALNSKASEMASQVNSTKRIVAYFSMEIALENAMPSYSGGLGVLAGDTIRAAADLRLPMVAVCLLYRKGYFTQRLAEDGSQTEEPVEWRVEDFLQEEPVRASVSIEDRRVELRCWRYTVKGVHGFEVPIYFLDADLPSNSDSDRNLTGALYGGDSYYRLCQEVCWASVACGSCARWATTTSRATT